MAVTGDYAAWADWLTRFGRGEMHEIAGLPAMSGDALGVAAAQRFAARCGAALDARLGLWARGLDRDRSRAAQPDELRLVLVNARNRLVPVRRFVGSDLLFAELRDGLTEALATVLTTLQDDLDRQASRAPLTVREAMIKVIRDVPLTRVVDVAPPAASPPVPAASGRRVLFVSTPGING